MRSIEEIRKDIAALEAELAGVIELEQHTARAEIARIAARVGLSVKDLVASAPKTRSKTGQPLRIKYRDGNGHEWTGHGRMPGWLKDMPNPEKYRVA